MFQNIDFLYFFGPVMLLATVFLVAFRYRQKRQNLNEFGKAVVYFKVTSIVFGVLVAILCLSLPVTPVLKSFGFPKDVLAIRDERKVLYLLQEYNRAIVRTTEVLQWFLFLFIWWFLTTLFGVVKTYRGGLSQFAQQAA